jgi:V8-like Glu-specific endopeptidase
MKMNKKHILCTFVVLILIITNSSYAFPKPMGRRAGLVSKSTSFYIPPEERTRNLTQSFTNDDNNAFSAIGLLSFKSASTGNTDYCTATVIQTDNGNIALTAAHCLWDILANNWNSEVSFYPGYDNGNQGSLGMIWAYTLTIWSSFAQDSEVTDYGFIKFYYEDGRKLQDDAGAFNYDGFVAGGEYPTTVFGYPYGTGQMDCPRDGEHLCKWQGNSNVPSSDLPNYNWYREIPIDVGNGASGGPWIRDYDANTNTGNIMGISHGMLLPPYPQSGTTSWAWENDEFSGLLQDAENYNP